MTCFGGATCSEGLPRGLATPGIGGDGRAAAFDDPPPVLRERLNDFIIQCSKADNNEAFVDNCGQEQSPLSLCAGLCSHGTVL
jgi:hypothetical protein